MFRELLNRLSITLPTALIEELENHKHKQMNQTYLLRFMEWDEIMETTEYMSEIEVYRDMIPLWTDDHSNYVGLHFRGACKYRISYISHEETDISPGFRTISSFIAALELHPDVGWEELKKDYPSDTERNRRETEEDLNAINELNHLVQDNESIDDDLRCQYIYSIMALTPNSGLDSLIPYLDDEDMYVQERACEIMGFHRYIPAREKLLEISLSGMHNGKSAAKRALARIKEKQFTEVANSTDKH